MSQELGPNQRKWLKALRSGHYKQGSMWLCREELNEEPEYCCLGIGCGLFMADSSWKKGRASALWECSGRVGTAPRKVIRALALRDEVGKGLRGPSLATLNDDGKTFAEIADLIESDPANWFTEPK